MLEEVVARLSRSGPLVLYGLFLKDYMSLSQKNEAGPCKLFWT